MNQCTAKLLPDENNQMNLTFDLVNVSESSKKFRSIINQDIGSNLRDRCYNFTKVDNCKINVSHTTKLKQTHSITTHFYESNVVPEYRCFCSSEDDINDNDKVKDKEYYEHNNEIITEHIKNYTIYPKDTYPIFFSGPTYGFHVKSNKKMVFKIMIGDVSFGNFVCENETWIHMEDLNGKIFKGAHDHYLNELQQRHSINLSRIDKLNIIVMNDSNNSIYFNLETLSFVTYNKFALTNVFVT